MNNQSLMSGIDQGWLEASLGKAAWAEAAPRWLEPEALLAGGGSQLPEDAALVWLYRSPAMSLLSAPAEADAPRLLEHWADTARNALNLRRTLKSRVRFACVDEFSPERMAVFLGLPGAPASADEPLPLAARMAFDTILAVRLPWLGEVLDLIGAASVPGDVAGPDTAEEPALVVAAQLRAIADALRAGELQYRHCQASLDAFVAERNRMLASIVDLQENFDAAATAQDRSSGHCIDLEQEFRSLYAQLNSARSGLAAERVERLRLAAESASQMSGRAHLLQQLIATQEELDSCMAVSEQVPALRQQLSYLQEELASRPDTLRGPVPETAPLLRRLKRRARRMLGGKGRGLPEIEREAALGALRATSWFDPSWYLSQYPDVSQAGMDPIVHYLDHGAAECRDPSPRFSTSFYVGEYPDVAAAGMNPLLHFIRHGLGEGRLPRRL